MFIFIDRTANVKVKSNKTKQNEIYHLIIDAPQHKPIWGKKRKKWKSKYKTKVIRERKIKLHSVVIHSQS